ncbi:MAG: preQ(1) synthase [Bacteroidia bacterium]|nr:preQ(1) synthase [Bacteroidia bacterium]
MLDNNKPSIKIADTRNEIQAEEKLKLLETFAFQSIYPQLIHIHTKEFSAVCPGTGLPDIGTLDIEYIPNQKCVELKALKYYLFSYRDNGIFQEPVTDLIFDHLWRTLEPKYLKISMLYNTRGGFDTRTIVEKGNRSILNPDQLTQI